MIEDRTPLSSTGQLRREQILAMALLGARKVRQARRIKRATIAGACAVTVAGLLLHNASSPPRFLAPPRPLSPLPLSDVFAVSSDGIPFGVKRIWTPPDLVKRLTVSASRTGIETIGTDPRTVSRLTLQIRPAAWQQLDDGGLLDALADAGRPAGLIEINGQTRLVFR